MKSFRPDLLVLLGKKKASLHIVFTIYLLGFLHLFQDTDKLSQIPNSKSSKYQIA